MILHCTVYFNQIAMVETMDHGNNEEIQECIQIQKQIHKMMNHGAGIINSSCNFYYLNHQKWLFVCIAKENSFGFLEQVKDEFLRLQLDTRTLKRPFALMKHGKYVSLTRTHANLFKEETRQRK